MKRVPSTPARCAKGKKAYRTGTTFRSTRRVVNGKEQWYWKKDECNKRYGKAKPKNVPLTPAKCMKGQTQRRGGATYRSTRRVVNGKTQYYWKKVDGAPKRRSASSRSASSRSASSDERACAVGACSPTRMAPVASAAANKGQTMRGRGGMYKSTAYMRSTAAGGRKRYWRWTKV